MAIIIPSVGCYSFSTDNPVRVLLVKDMSGQIIYCRKFDGAYKFDINFPIPGGYQFITDSSAVVKPTCCESLYRPYVPELPITNHSGVKVSGKIFKIKGSDGSPCSINLKTGDILTNERFARFPKYAKDFCLAHEEGHLKYLSEDDCDYYALRKIIMQGGNIMPCIYTLESVLSKNVNNNLRIKEFLSHIKKII